MTGIVVTGGDAPGLKYVKEYFQICDCIVAADSGLETLVGYGYQPDMVLGDMDSLRNLSLLNDIPENKIMRFPEDKDFTDTELALDYLYRKGYEEIILIGGGGGRLDHLLALYSLFSREKSPDLWITSEEKIFLVKNHFSIKLKKNSLISFFPLGIKNCKMSSNGLKWELDGLNWGPGDSGVSNVALKETIKIDMISGKLIMIIPIGESL